MHALLLLNMNLYTKFEMTSFTYSKDMITAKKFLNGSRNTHHTNQASLSSQG